MRLKQVFTNQILLCQPSHWLAEVVAVITRIQADIAELTIDFNHNAITIKK